MTRNVVVFGDESGTQGGDARVLIVGGYLASPRQWKLFDAAWRGALADFTGCVPFHSKDFFQQARWQSSTSPYHGWTLERADEFLQALIGVIDRFDIRPVGGCVDLIDWQSFDEDVRKYLTGAILRTRYEDFRLSVKVMGDGAPVRPPYTAALIMMKWQSMREAKPGVVVNFILDENTTEESRAKEVFSEGRKSDQRIGDLTFSTDELHPGLQAADLYCYSWQRHVTRSKNNTLVRTATDWIVKKRDPWIVDRALVQRHLEATAKRQTDNIRSRFERL